MKLLNEWQPEGHGPLVQIATRADSGGRYDFSVNANVTSYGGRLSDGDRTAGTSEDRAAAARVGR